jgi:SAM-dependent methyltransferase
MGGWKMKTDLFEEAVTPHHPLSDLGPGSLGMDFSESVVQAAGERLQGEMGEHPLLAGDLRRIPLRSSTLSGILSGSSLDHFSDPDEIAGCLEELVRVMADNGVLVITFDNPHNPLVWLRNKLPYRWLRRFRLVPYYVGATYGRDEARWRLESLGLRITDVTAAAHAPRALVIGLLALAERFGWDRVRKTVGKRLGLFERLERWPTRYLTGYYVALRAEKPPRPGRGKGRH